MSSLHFFSRNLTEWPRRREDPCDVPNQYSHKTRLALRTNSNMPLTKRIALPGFRFAHAQTYFQYCACANLENDLMWVT